MIDFLIRARYVVLLVVVSLLVAFLASGRRVEYDQSIQSFFADDDPSVLLYKRSSALFGNDQFVFIAYDDPALLTGPGMDRLAELAGRVQPAAIEGVTGVQSLEAMPVFWQLDDALFALERMPGFAQRAALAMAKRGLGSAESSRWATPTIGRAIRSAEGEALKELERRITKHPLLRGTVVSPDGRSTALVVQLKNAGEHDAKVTVAALRDAADSFAAKHQLARPHLVGPPVLLADGFTAIETDGLRLSWAGMLLIALVTFSATRSPWWAIVPMLAGWTVWMGTQWALSTLGIRLSLSSGPIIAQIIVLTMPATSHLAMHFRDDLRSGTNRRVAASETLRSVAVPILWCTLAGAIGYGALITSNVVPIRQFGAVLAICTACAALLALALSPSAMLPPLADRLAPSATRRSGLARAVDALLLWVHRHPRAVVLGALAVVIPLAPAILRLEYESNYVNAFKPQARVVGDYYAVEAKLGGIGLVGLVVPAGREITPESVDRLKRLTGDLNALKRPDGTPSVSQVVSLATVLDPDNRLDGLPADRQAWHLSTKLDLIQSTPQASLLSSFWDAKEGQSRVVVRLIERQPAPIKEATFAGALEAARKQFGPDVFLAGLSHLLTQTTRGVIATQWTTFGWALAGILVTLALSFRSPAMAVFALLPAILSVTFVLGLMGWLGLQLDLATALVASVALGLSVDDTFHCLLQYRRLRRTQDPATALLSSYSVTGPGVLLSSGAVAVGFTVLWFSEFVPFSTFGAMVAIATAGSSLGNLLLLPALLTLWDRPKPSDRQTTDVRRMATSV